MADVEPNFLIIGAAKSGTTSLYWMLAQHPDVFVSPIKETNYFAYDESRASSRRFKVRTREAYLDLFRQGAGYRARGEASPAYLEQANAAERIRAELPDARLIAILRDPAERCYSAYRMAQRLQRVPFDAESAFAADAHWLQRDARAVRASRYAERLQPYLDCFEPAQLKLLLFDDLESRPQHLLDEVFAFLDLEPATVPWSDTRHNFGGTPRSTMLERTLRSLRIGRLLRRIPRLQGLGRRVRNASLAEPPPLPSHVRAALIECFRDDVMQLEKLIGRDLSGWLDPKPGSPAQP